MRDPVELFREWFEAARAGGLELPEAMTLATADTEGRPSARTVLLKSADERGFIFFTNYDSRKGRELTANPSAALVFHWPQEPRRQVLVSGTVERISEAESDAYYATRPVGSRLAQRGRPARAVRFPGTKSSSAHTRKRSRPTERTRRALRSGAAICSFPRPSSSGKAARTASTSGFATRAAPTRAGEPSRSLLSVGEPLRKLRRTAVGATEHWALAGLQRGHAWAQRPEPSADDSVRCLPTLGMTRDRSHELVALEAEELDVRARDDRRRSWYFP